MFRRALLLAACVALPSVATAQAPAKAPTKAPAKVDSAKAAMHHDMGGMKHEAMDHAKMDHAKMDHAKMDHAAMAGGKHDMSQCPMHEVHAQMMAFYKAVMADSVIHARIRDTKALHDQHHAIDSLMETMPAHGAGGMSMDCPMMKKDKPTG
jgi:uncharacterized protein involved in copper resistance